MLIGYVCCACVFEPSVLLQTIEQLNATLAAERAERAQFQEQLRAMMEALRVKEQRLEKLEAAAKPAN